MIRRRCSTGLSNRRRAATQCPLKLWNGDTYNVPVTTQRYAYAEFEPFSVLLEMTSLDDCAFESTLLPY